MSRLLDCVSSFRSLPFQSFLAAALVSMLAADLVAQGLVPGTGRKITQVGDNFEDAEWGYVPNRPKSTRNLDKNDREPAGFSKNERWYEGPKRGQPDLIRRVPTPEGGLSGSEGALMLRSCYTGIPGSPSYEMQQDDFIADVQYALGGPIPLSRAPSVVVRVYLPPFKHWEKRTGPTFAFRASVEPPASNHSYSRWSRKPKEPDTYWPGMLIDFHSKADSDTKEEVAYLRIRSDESGNDYRGPRLKELGWWTLGMSFTPNGQVHYYASPGVDDLTQKDYIASHFCYGERGIELNTFFFNVCSADDGRTWSTPWIIDDPTVYIAR